jgi:cell division transport system permease protein
MELFMKRLKSLISFILPLIAMLITFSIYLIVNKVVDNYQKNIVNDFSIVVISIKPLQPIRSVAGIGIKNIDQLNRNAIIGGIKDNLSDSALELLDRKLPYFYKVHLATFPNNRDLMSIKRTLLANKNIQKVETFTVDHNQIYSLLALTQSIVIALFVVVLISSFLLLLKQIQIWFFEHNERITILQLHGASLIYSSKAILSIMIISIVISILLVVSLLFLALANVSMVVSLDTLQLIPDFFDLQFELLQIVVLAIITPLIAFFGLLIKYKTNA